MISFHSIFNKHPREDEDIHYIDVGETDSTNNYLKSLLATLDGVEHEPRLTVAYADYQTAGRGQGDHRWYSEPGKNLLFSIMCHPVWVPVASQFLILEAESLALRDALASLTDGITIKWPNDIYWQDKKISGTITETAIHGGHVKDCILGTGVNVNQQKFDCDAPNPVSLYQILGHDTDRMALLKDIVGRFDTYLTDLRNGNYEKIVTLYMSYLYRSHGFFPFRDKDGEFEAAIVEVEDDGHLILRDRGDHIRSYAFREVDFLQKDAPQPSDHHD